MTPLKLDESELLMMRLLKFKYWCRANTWGVDYEVVDSDLDSDSDAHCCAISE